MKQAKSEELRRGNLVNLCFNHKPGWFQAKVTAIHADGTIDTDTNEPKGSMYYWEGLFITEDLLLKAGFVKDGILSSDSWYHTNNRHQMIPREYGIWVYRVPGVSLVEIRHVHQLQNIFYVLTGKELTL